MAVRAQELYLAEKDGVLAPFFLIAVVQHEDAQLSTIRLEHFGPKTIYPLSGVRNGRRERDLAPRERASCMYVGAPSRLPRLRACEHTTGRIVPKLSNDSSAITFRFAISRDRRDRAGASRSS